MKPLTTVVLFFTAVALGIPVAQTVLATNPIRLLIFWENYGVWILCVVLLVICVIREGRKK